MMHEGRVTGPDQHQEPTLGNQVPLWKQRDLKTRHICLVAQEAGWGDWSRLCLPKVALDHMKSLSYPLAGEIGGTSWREIKETLVRSLASFPTQIKFALGPKAEGEKVEKRAIQSGFSKS
jgi:hypothetical protein